MMGGQLCRRRLHILLLRQQQHRRRHHNHSRRHFSLWSTPPADVTTHAVIVTPGNVSSRVPKVSPGIAAPDYSAAATALIPLLPVVWSEAEIAGIRNSSRLARAVLDTVVKPMVRPGVTTDELDAAAHDCIVGRFGAYPSTLGFQGFPRSLSTSVNNVAAHGVPDDRPLEKGDVLSVDVAVFAGGFHGDCAETYVVGGECDDAAGRRIVDVAKECLFAGIAACGPGQTFRQVI